MKGQSERICNVPHWAKSLFSSKARHPWALELKTGIWVRALQGPNRLMRVLRPERTTPIVSESAAGQGNERSIVTAAF